MIAGRFASLVGVVFATSGFANIDSRQATLLPTTGVVVEAVAVGSGAQRAGLQPDDVIVTWANAVTPRAEAGQAIRSAFDLVDVEIEHAPRRSLILQGFRRGTPTEWMLERGILGLTVRPGMPSGVLALYQAGQELIAKKLAKEGAEQWRQAALQADQAGSALTSAWLLSRAGRALSDARQWDAADPILGEARQRIDGLHVPTIVAQFYREQGRSYQLRNDWPRATEWYERALEADRQVAPESLAGAGDRELLGIIAYQQGDIASAEAAHKRALAMREALAPDSAGVAESLNSLAAVADDRGDLKTRDAYQKRSLDIFERVAPGTVRLSNVVHNLGIAAQDRGDLVGAEAYYRRGLAIREAVVPDSLHVALSLNSLGLVARLRGDLEESEALHRRALAIQERDAPGSLAVAGSLGNLGIVLRLRGDLRNAEDFMRRALDIQQRLAPDSLDVAGTLNNLGNVQIDRGDYDDAEVLHRQALAIRERVAPGALIVGLSLNNIGNVAMLRRDFETAKGLYARSLAIKEKVAPRSTPTVITLNNLGRLAYAEHDLAAAETYHQRALALLEQIAPASVERQTTLYALAQVAYDRKDFATARSYALRSIEMSERTAVAGVPTAEAFQVLGRVMLELKDPRAARDYVERSLKIVERVAPGSLLHASVLHTLGLVYREEGNRSIALQLFTRAVDAFETQATKAGGAQDVRSGFRLQGMEFYQSAVDMALALARRTDAFAFQERYRARSLLGMIAERDLLFAADVPSDIARNLKVASVEYDRIVNRLSSLGPDSKREVDPLLARLRELRDSREQLTRRVRQLSPRLAALQYPQPLALDAVRASLDPGTLLLSYWIGPDRSVLFVVRPDGTGDAQGGLSIYNIPVSEKRLRAAVRDFRNAMLSGRNGVPQARAVGGVTGRSSQATSLPRQASRLYDLLLKPAEPLIARSARLLLVLDGPLHGLPFAALMPAGGAARPARYLVEWKPLHVVASATVYAETRRLRGHVTRTPSSKQLVAFGDPDLPETRKDVGPTPSTIPSDNTAPRGLSLAPLPAARREVRAIAALFGDAATVFVGPDATEARAKSIPRDVAYVHFASHAVLDERLPLNSALVLAAPANAADRNNGLLQVWEIFEGMRLDADLVTLSACETALGEEFGGEGLMGLTRAFQYSGARAVVASLWRIADDSTADLMTRFYKHLREGRSTDEALRSAQIDAIRSPGSVSHPFNWAAFELFGDWR